MPTTKHTQHIERPVVHLAEKTDRV